MPGPDQLPVGVKSSEMDLAVYHRRSLDIEAKMSQ